MSEPLQPLGEAPRLSQLIEQWRNATKKRMHPALRGVEGDVDADGWEDLRLMERAVLRNCANELEALLVEQNNWVVECANPDFSGGRCRNCGGDNEAHMPRRVAEGAARRGPPCQTCQSRGWVMRTEHHDLGNGLASGGAWNKPCPDCASKG